MKKITLLMMLFVASIGMNAQTTTQEYTFNADLEGWIAGGGVTVAHEAAIGFTALGALNFTGPKNKVTKHTTVATGGNGDYTLSYKARSIISGSKIRTQYRDGANALIKLGDTPLDGSEVGIDAAGWTTVSHQFTLVGGETAIKIELKNSTGVDANETFYIDDIKIVKAAVVGSTLSVTTVGGGIIAYTPIKAGYAATDVVSLTATPSTHWVFGAWTGDLTSTNATENVTMDTNKDITGTFTIEPGFDYNFMFETAGDSEGWVENNGTVVVDAGVLKYSTPTGYAKIVLENFPIPADDYNWVRVKMTNQTSGDNELRFLTSVGTFAMPITNGDVAEQTYEFALDTLGTIGGTLPTTWTGAVEDGTFRFGTTTDGKSVGGDYLISSIEFYQGPTLSNESILRDDTQLSIYPNPVRNTLSVKSSAKINNLQIYNVTGQEVLRSSEATINTSSLTKGVYIIKVSQEGGAISTKRFIKE